MINSKKECENFVSYCNYPPKGKRSFGPMRAQLIYGLDFYEKANENITAITAKKSKSALPSL